MAQMEKAFTKPNKGRGFTLIELMVVISIITILSVMVFINQRSSQSQYLITQAVQKLTSDLRRTQNMAMSGTQIAGNYYGYGIYAERNNNFYIIFGDRNDNKKFDGEPTDTIIENIKLPSNVTISSVSPSDKVHVFFRPPDPLTSISDGTSDMTEASIVLVISSGQSLSRTVKVTHAGLVETQ